MIAFLLRTINSTGKACIDEGANFAAMAVLFWNTVTGIFRPSRNIVRFDQKPAVAAAAVYRR